MRRYWLAAAAMLAAGVAQAQDAHKSANLTAAGGATCAEATIPRGCVYFPTTGSGSVVFRLSGTWAGTVLVEGSPDGDAADAWVALDIFTIATGAWTMAASTTANGTYAVSATGMRTLRVRVSVYTSGTVVVDGWTHSDPWSVLFARNASGQLVAAFAAGSDVDVAKIGTAATVDTALTAQAADFDVEAATANMRLVSWTARESAAGAAAATVVLRHGVLAAGNCTAGGVIAFVELAPNESVGHSYDARGLAVASGVCADVLAGTVDVAIATIVEAAP